MITDEQKQIEIYQTDDGQTQIEVRLEQDTVWLTQAQMAELFGRERSVITKHISNVFKDGELDRIEKQYVQNLHILLKMGKSIRLRDLVWTSLFLLATALSLLKACAFGNGLPAYCENI